MARTQALKRRYGHAVSPHDVVFERSGGWWAVSVPGIAGGYSQGRTKQSAYNNLLDALSGLEAARRDGLIK